MTMPIDLVLVRHGESEGNVAVKASKRGDDSLWTPELLARHSSSWRLTDKGREQARAAGEWIKRNIGDRFNRYYTSGYVRAMETAALLDLPETRWYLEYLLRERDYGYVDVITRREREQRFGKEMARRDVDGLFWTPPNGESMAQAMARIIPVLSTLHRECEDRRVIIVSHGETMWLFRIRLERFSQQRYQVLDQSTDPRDQIHNCQVLQYSRCDPVTGAISPYVKWMRSVCPTDLSKSRNDWEEIQRRGYSNEELLAEVDLISRSVVS